ncbi:MAG: Mu Gam family protein, partial [Pedosphaera sp.]|nr:Mu Gam family protein [Pedosphaera sp.]
ASAKNHERLTTARMDAEIGAVRDKYQPALEANAQRLAEMSTAVQGWAEANPQEFHQRKSIEFVCGTIGFRTGTPKLKTLGRQTWDVVLQALRRVKWGSAYIRTKEEINKEQLIADVSAQSLSAADLLKIGAVVIREESFFIDPKLTETETRQVARAEAA